MSGATGSIRVRYDRERDVLYISLGQPRPGYAAPAAGCDRLLFRYDDRSDQVIGATIFGFRRLDRKLLQSIMPFPVDLESINP